MKIQFKNKVILSKGEISHGGDTNADFHINWDYNPDAYDETMDKFLDKISCNDADVRQSIIDMVSHCFITEFKKPNQKMFVLEGRGANGKSALLDVVRYIFVDEVSDVPMHNMSHPFANLQLVGKLVNIDATSSRFTEFYLHDIKPLIKQKPSEVQIKGYPPILNWKNIATHIVETNDVTCSDENCIVIPMLYDYHSDNDRVVIHDGFTFEAIEYLIKLAVERYPFVYNNGPTIKKEYYETKSKK